MNSDRINQMVNCMDTIETGGQMADKFMDAINSFSNDPDEFCKALSQSSPGHQEVFTEICLLWLVKMESFNLTGRYDLRNEYSVKMGHMLYDALKHELSNCLNEESINEVEGYSFNYRDDYLNSNTFPFTVSFVQYASMGHRTLQQTLSSYIFTWLKQCPVTLSEIMKDLIRQFEVYHYMFHRTPMI